MALQSNLFCTQRNTCALISYGAGSFDRNTNTTAVYSVVLENSVMQYSVVQNTALQFTVQSTVHDCIIVQFAG